MSPQEIFDTVATHLLTQNARASDGCGTCFYLAPDDTKCAVGCLIPDGHPAQRFSGPVSLLGVSYRFPWLTESNLPLLRELQVLHDAGYVTEWPAKLIEIARFFNLDDRVVRGFMSNQPTAQ